MNLPLHILTEQNTTTPFEDYCKQKAEEANAKYHSKEVTFTADLVKRLAAICDSNEEELDPDNTPPCVFEVCESVCRDLERTFEIARDLQQPSMTEEMKELEILGNKTEEEKQLNSQEIEMVEAAKGASFHDFVELEKAFDFGPEATQINVREGHIATPKDYAAILGAGVDMSAKGMWIVGEAVNRLLAMGFENVLYQIAGDLKMSYATVSAWHRTCERIKPEDRLGLPPTVAQEIACARFSKDKEENQKKIDEMVYLAKEHGWNSSEARSHIQASKEGQDSGRQGKARNSGSKAQERAIKAAADLFSQVIPLLQDNGHSGKAQHIGLVSQIDAWLERYGK